MRPIIEIKNLKKSFGDVHAVQNISFEVREGELFAFLGLNGAGKSTTISILCGQLKKDDGEVFIDGIDVARNPDRIKREIGVVFQSSVLDKPLSVYDNLESRAALYGITGAEFQAKLHEISDLLALEPLLRRPVGKLSGGQRRRIDIARALLHSPKILILDEPTTGLDPQTRKLLWNAISRLRREKGMTVFLTTHYMEEAADADDIVILDSGKIAAKGTPIDLKNAYSGDFITFYHTTPSALAPLGYPVETIGSVCRIAIQNTAIATEMIQKHPALFVDYEITKGKMDDVFLNVTGKSLIGGDEK